MDENLLNSLSTIFAQINSVVSIKDIMKYKKNWWVAIKDKMNTGILAKVLPSIKEDYGDDKNIDIVLTPSHAEFKKGFPNSDISQFQMDKDGNWKISLNLFAKLRVEMSPG